MLRRRPHVGPGGIRRVPGLVSLANRLLRPLGFELTRLRKEEMHPVASLAPDGKPVGRVLLSYVVEPFLVPAEAAISRDHTHDWESWRMAQSFLTRGFAVDVVSFKDSAWKPEREYDVLVAARQQLERLASHLPPRCLKVAHLDTAHWLTNNSGLYARLNDARERRGAALHGRRMVEANWAVEAADIGCVLGNDFTADSYGYAGKPIHRLPISTTATFDWPEGRDLASARFRYIWFGSDGFVLKGLDRVLEAFQRLPEPFLLRVCAPLEAERRFVEAYRQELYHCPRVEPVGWVDVGDQRLRDFFRDSIGAIYPSASEGGGGSAITCMHGGLIPILTREASVDMPGFGVQLGYGTVDEVVAAVQSLAGRSAADLEADARRAWEHARRVHTRESFGAAYDRFVDDVVIPEVERRRKGNA
jgi:glycosyltransferase involved in cell wall biosynthesis